MKKLLSLLVFAFAGSALAEVPLPSSLKCKGQADQGFKFSTPVEYSVDIDPTTLRLGLRWIEREISTREKRLVPLPVSVTENYMGSGLKVMGTFKDESSGNSSGLLVFNLIIPPYCPNCPSILQITDTENFRRQFMPNCEF